MIRSVFALALVCSTMTGGYAQSTPTAAVRATVKVSGIERSYVYYVSTKSNSFNAQPLVFVLHPAGQTAASYAASSGWITLAEDRGFAVVFPQARPEGWRGDGSDTPYLKAVFDQASANTPSRFPGDVDASGKPVPIWAWETLRHVVGEGSGAAAAAALVAEHPGLFAGVALNGPSADDSVFGVGYLAAQGYFNRGLIAGPVWRQKRKDVPEAIWSFGPQSAKQSGYWKLANAELGLSQPSGPATPTLIWDGLLQHLARWTSSANGDLDHILTRAEVAQQFERRTIKLEDGDHSYFVKFPSTWKKSQKLPLVFSLHGRFEQAWRFLSKIRMHDVGERAGFITVYPEGVGTRWASGDPVSSDARFLEAIPADLDRAYGIDTTRIYMQGFSNGSAMTHMMGMTRPNMFAAIAPSNASVVALPPPPLSPDPRVLPTMLEPTMQAYVDKIKVRYDYLMPVFYFTGQTDSELAPDGVVGQRTNINAQKNFWKAYNHISAPDDTRSVAPIDGRAPYTEVLLSKDVAITGKDARWPEGRFVTHLYRTDDPGHTNLYNLTVVTDLPHAYDFRQAQMTWDYFKHFRRMPDGSLSITK